MSLRATFCNSLGEIAAEVWDGLFATDMPFVSHKFLSLLEATGCTTARSGWAPMHLRIDDGEETVLVMPLYLRSDSSGEFVFDWAWASAYERAGGNYYPKLLTAIPFSPVQGLRYGIAEGRDADALLTVACNAVQKLARQHTLSSWHVLFPHNPTPLAEHGMHLRRGCQFHWFNRDYKDFDDFLGQMKSRKRKTILRERRLVREQGIEMRILQGADLAAPEWERFYLMYQRTYNKRGMMGYLTPEFFQQLRHEMPDQLVLITARRQGEMVAAALCLRDASTLYGRYWGCARELNCLHFETCYYSGIEYCIANGLQRFDPGAQGEHKVSRGFEPVPTWSAHWIADPGFEKAVADFLTAEREHLHHYQNALAEELPFRLTTPD